MLKTALTVLTIPLVIIHLTFIIFGDQLESTGNEFRFNQLDWFDHLRHTDLCYVSYVCQKWSIHCFS
ncbi:hypothetical protein SAMN04488072_104124 [Lentibacillus halodurans]|uniref:Uncharacterized protein n=1 Tax=Lentibacillus halodurans TaxID=237679 RepID=A0A1I0X4Z9_9BACI|nr:hypothetical protein SAMN04488072_104124 [Lentibacillus halodurans]